MSRFGAVFLAAAMLAAVAPLPPALAAEQAPHRITRDAAWGCRDKGDVINLLFQGLSVSFDGKLAAALADGRCVSFTPGESVMLIESGANGLVRIERPGAPPAQYWTVSRNLD
jgi:hypothetical protein